MPLISDEAFEEALLEARATTNSDVEGLFGPSSQMWQIGREAALFLGAGRAALLQTAHPFVAAAIEQHSDARTDPVARFRRTFANVFDMVFGSAEDAVEKARAVRRIHGHINGTLEENQGRYEAGTPYSARDLEATRWVHATLWDSALRSYEMFHPPLDKNSRETYWQESLRFAALFGLRACDMPASFTEFETWQSGVLASDQLSVGTAARDIADHLLNGKGQFRALPKWYVAVTAGLLPPPLRQAYGLTFGPMDRRRAESAIARLQKVYPMFPEKLRYVPAWHRAEARLKGKAAPDIVTRGLEKLWLGS